MVRKFWCLLCGVVLFFIVSPSLKAQDAERRLRIALLMSDNYSKPVVDAMDTLGRIPQFSDRFDIVTTQNGASAVETADVVVCYVHTPQVVQRFAQQMKKVIERGGVVYAVGHTAEAANYEAWGMQFDATLEPYFDNPNGLNMTRLVQLLCDRHLGGIFAPQGPMDFPDYAMIDWRTGKLYTAVEDFQEAYETDSADAPWVAIYGFRYEFVTGQDGYLRAYAKGLADAGFNVMLCYGFPLERVLEDFCIHAKGKPRIDVLVNCSSLPGGSPEKLAVAFSALGVPVINGISVSQTKAAWAESTIGISIAQRSLALARPEIMGQIQPTVLATQEIVADQQGNRFKQKTQLSGRIAHLVGKVKAWTALRKKPNAKKEITLIYYNGHPGKHNIGASYLNVLPHSIYRILTALDENGYDVGSDRLSEKAVFERVMSGGRNIGSQTPEELVRLVREERPVLIPMKVYKEWFANLHPRFRQQVVDKWGEPDSARIMVWTDDKKERYLVLPQVTYGNIHLMPQPARGWDEDEEALFHDVSLPPHHQYIAFYLYLQQQQQADALIHLGTHGTLEWLSGREAGLDADDAPDALLGSMVNIYPYIMDNVGEGTQAKRRGGAVIIDHLTPPFQEAGLRPELRELAGAINDYSVASEKSTVLADAHLKKIKRLAKQINIGRDLDIEGDITGNDVQRLEHYLQELNEKQTPMGMHTFGVSPDPAKARLTAVAMSGRQINVPQHERDSLTDVFFDRIMRSGPAEMQALLDALEGKFIEPALGNDPIRNPDALPTGRNFYALDPSRMPSADIYEAGSALADELVKGYLEQHEGVFPDKVAFNLWSVETIRHEGIMESQILNLLGVRPTYDGFGKVKGVELIPRDSLNRPRVDVLVTPSGLYRDMFPQMMQLLDQAVALAYEAPEKDNVVRLHVDSTARQLADLGVDDANLRQRLAMVRLFGSASGTYGIGVDNAVQASDKWEDNRDIAEVYFNRSGHLYGQGFWGADDGEVQEMTGKDLALSMFRKALSGTKAVVHSRSTNVYGVLDNDDFFQYLGGMTLAIKTLDGTEPDVMVSNLTDPSAMRQESLDKFIGREMNTRYLNPSWIENMLDEGYAGARMIGQVTDNMWGWQATTDQAIRPEDWQEWHDVYVADKYELDMKQRFADADNLYAYQAMLEKMLEVTRKEYWKPDETTVNNLKMVYLETVQAIAKAENIAGAADLTGRGREAPAAKIPASAYDQPTETSRTAADQSLKGYKMKEETLFKAGENTPMEKELDGKILLVLVLVFGLGFLGGSHRP
ncbi:cobaltochelatase subunit CobN [Sphingobacterium gobiense]|uniref:Cobalt chelatase n=1 Tax=Sphingobacterium gobiense TaxID=1382456 RepID=A0A2S9JUQ6_9SPHI|nr:cobaltochelatase subunit CobN [Sphingobacterium gobiense]PRD56999.1 cobalt chelatase [Sphingobacterium gobiense]